MEICLYACMPWQCLFFLLQHKRNKDTQSRLSTPEIKLIVLFVYYTIFGVLSSYFSVSMVDKSVVSASFQEYFRCESLGLPNNCSKPTQEWLLFLLAFGYFLLSSNTSVNLTYVINWRKAKLLLLRCLQRRNWDKHALLLCLRSWHKSTIWCFCWSSLHLCLVQTCTYNCYMKLTTIWFLFVCSLQLLLHKHFG